jgi:glycosyltransferase involved in cell wall biosynthesis
LRRILHLRTVTGKGGGPEKTLLATPKHLGSDYEVRLAYLRPSRDPCYDMPDRAREFGATLVDIPESGPADPRSLLRLVAEMKHFRPHVLHAHDYKTNVLSLLLGYWFGTPVVTTLHGYVTLGGKLNWYYRIDRWALRRMHHLIAVSPDLYDFLGGLGIPAACRSLVENGIDTELYRRSLDPRECKERFGLDRERILVGAVGRLQPEKGFHVLIESAASLLDQGLDFDLAIAGDGPERTTLQALIQTRGYAGRIRLLGHCSRTIELYQAMDVFVLSSLREGLPNVLLEAMALQVPVVATTVGGVPRLVQHEVSGLRVPCGEPEALAAAMKTLLGDAALRLKLAAAGRRTIEEQFSFAQRMRRIRGIYDHVLGNGE